MARRGLILAIVGAVVWIALLAIVLGSVITSKKISAKVRSVGQTHLADNPNERSRMP